MKEYNYNFEDFAAKMMKNASLNIKDTDLEIQEFENYLIVHNERFNNIINSLSKEDRIFTRNYIDKQIYIKEAFNDGLYLEGYKDCVKLLKILQVL